MRRSLCLAGQDQDDDEKEQRHDHTLDLYLAGLCTETSARLDVCDGLYSGVHVARAARGETHSGLRVCLEHAEHPEEEWDDGERSPPVTGAKC